MQIQRKWVEWSSWTVTTFLRFIYYLFCLILVSNIIWCLLYRGYISVICLSAYIQRIHKENCQLIFFFIIRFVFFLCLGYLVSQLQLLEIIIPLLQTNLFFFIHFLIFWFRQRIEKTGFYLHHFVESPNLLSVSFTLILYTQLKQHFLFKKSDPTTRYLFNQKRYTNEYNFNLKMTHTIRFLI